jgi:hypothetical protein
MGIAFSFLPFLDSCHRQQALQSPLLALGSLELHELEDDILLFANKYSYKNLLKDKSIRSLFLDRYKVDTYHDCDINDKADIYLDLNFSISEDMAGIAATILDGGTIEHLFDIKQAFTNLHQMVRTGGTIIHISPLTWFNHGFVNFNPKLFKGIIQANEYHLIVEAFSLSQPNRRFGSKKQGQHIYVTFDGQEHPEAMQFIKKQFDHNCLPANSLYMIAYKKERDEKFRYPYDM